jgi:hypothetical protein
VLERLEKSNFMASEIGEKQSFVFEKAKKAMFCA